MPQQEGASQTCECARSSWLCQTRIRSRRGLSAGAARVSLSPTTKRLGGRGAPLGYIWCTRADRKELFNGPPEYASAAHPRGDACAV